MGDIFEDLMLVIYIVAFLRMLPLFAMQNNLKGHFIRISIII